ncbi:glycerol-3-phosphate dehydrogenase, mitochondrial-like isoform X3 [Scylla paramamosain]|uniref:glycerol-3-phosphate dehydrogenase, mitochondrial-like isoform X3 n=1 Tax=Scylla paramamosain TaxID=85552 RepID=UPI003082A70E
MPSSDITLFHILDSNWLPRSEVRLRGTPNLEIQVVMKARVTESVVMSAKGAASGQRVKRSTQRQFIRVAAAENLNNRPTKPLPTREQQLKSLSSESFDVLIIGGGATGAGCALDSVSRGLKTALVEMEDFSSGTSSRSTKLIHGGVRYLQKAILGLDIEQYRMVKEALHERANLLDIAPHLSYPLPIMLPVYKWWQLPYFWAGIKMYDLVAGSKCLKSSYAISKERALELFPMLKKDKLVGAIVYYDGQHNDARMNLSIALTATRLGATIANHARVLSLMKEEDENGKEKLCGARVRDEVTGKEITVKAKCIVNATGPFTDSVRKMDNQVSKEICAPSLGVHITLPDYYSPEQMGLLDPNTSDGRVIFFLPWEGRTIAGTTDTPCDVSHSPAPTEDDIQFILREVRNYLNPDVEVRRGDVLSAWAGIRPLVQDPNKTDTQSIARNHIVHVSENGLVTIAGGKWTTYRSMASEAIDTAIKACNLSPAHQESQTDGLLLEGAHKWTPTMYIRLVQDFGLESEVAKHLAHTYGDRAFSVAKLASLTGKRWPIEKVCDHEVLWNIRHPHYPKKTMKRRIFEEIRNQLIETHPEMASLTADDLFGKFSYLRGNFQRVLCNVCYTPSGFGGKPEPKWEYFKACSFLLPVYDNHSFQSSLELPPQEDVVYEGTLEDLVQLDFSPLYSPRSIGISRPPSAASTSLSIDAPCTSPESQTPSPQGPVDTAKLQAVVYSPEPQEGTHTQSPHDVVHTSAPQDIVHTPSTPRCFAYCITPV